MRVKIVAAVVAGVGLAASVILAAFLLMQAGDDQRAPARVVDRGFALLTYETMPRGGELIVEQRRPFAQTEERDLDAWVREGGKLAIVVQSPDAWAVTPAWLDPLNARWTVRRRDGGWRIGAGCTAADGGRIADCRIGEGRVLLDLAPATRLRRAELTQALRSGDPLRAVEPPFVSTHALLIALGIAVLIAFAGTIVWSIALLQGARRATGPARAPARVTRSFREETG